MHSYQEKKAYSPNWLIPLRNCKTCSLVVDHSIFEAKSLKNHDLKESLDLFYLVRILAYYLLIKKQLITIRVAENSDNTTVC